MSERFDLLVRGGRIAAPEGLVVADIGVSGGRIELVAPGIEGFAPLEGTLYPYYDSVASPRG